jgi:hypothetical protein
MTKKLFLLALCMLMLAPVLFSYEKNDADKNVSGNIPTINYSPKLLYTQEPIIIDHRGARDLLWDQQQSAQGPQALACQADTTLSFFPRCADNFTIPYDADIDSLVWWGYYWNTMTNVVTGWNIEFYVDSGGGNGPQQAATFWAGINSWNETDLGGWYRYEATIPPFSATTGVTYYLVTQPVLIFPPQWGVNADTPPNVGDGNEGYFKSAYFGYPQWVTATTLWGTPYEWGFQIYGTPSAADTFTWDFEDGWQDWTHTNGNTYPAGWGIIDSLSSHTHIPVMGESLLAIDDDAAGSGTSVIDTAISPKFEGFAENWLYWLVGYNNIGSDWVTIILRYFDGASWNQTTLVQYTSDQGAYGAIPDSVDVSSFTGDTFQLLIEYNDGGVWAWWCEFDNIGPVFLFPPLTNDMASWTIDWPPATVLLNEVGDPTATFKNVGGTQATFDAHFEIDTNGVNVYTGNVQSITLDPGLDTTWVFTPQWTAGPTEGIAYNVTVYCVLPGDENPGNDTLTQVTTTSAVGDWIQCTNQPVAALANATGYDPVNDRVYSFGGGDGGSNYYNHTFQYDPGSDSWSTMATMPYSGDWIDACYSTGYFHIIGGYNGSANTWNMIYDIAGDNWTTGAALPTGKHSASLVTYNDSLVYVLGGRLSSGTATSDVYIYNIYTDSWTTGTSMPITVHKGNSVIIADTIYHVSGWDNGGTAHSYIYVGVIDPLNCESITWSTGPALPYANAAAGAATAYRNGDWYIYMVGGFMNGSTPIATAYEYNMTTATWSQLPDYTPFAIARGNFLTSRDGYSEIYVCGGDAGGAWSATDQVWKLPWATGIEEEKPVKNAMVFGLAQNVPNPLSNGNTQIAYVTTRSGPVSLKIYDNAGRLVRTLVDAQEDAGRKTVTWDGKDNNNNVVAAGIYFYRLAADGKVASKKMVVVK